MMRLTLRGFLLAALLGCGNSSDEGGGAVSTAPLLTFLETVSFEEGTHRPEVLVTAGGEVLLVVVQPDGSGAQEGAVKHRAYRLDSSLNPIADPFVVTRFASPYGEPADHRAALVAEELWVVYQTLNMKEGTAGVTSGPAEQNATGQSLMLARFTLEGEELFRGPIVDRATDFSEDNFPDMCILWREDRLLVSTGNNSNQMKIREVDSQAQILATYTYDVNGTGIRGTIGNSLVEVGGVLTLLSSSGPNDGRLTVTQFDAAMTPTVVAEYTDEEIEFTFPTGTWAYDDYLFVGASGRARGGDPALETNPYSPYLFVFDASWKVVDRIPLGEKGFGHVHPTLALLEDGLLAAWSRQAESTESVTAPQVRLEVFQVE